MSDFRGLRPLFALIGLSMAGGCSNYHYHRGPIDIWTDLIHKMRGGVGSGLNAPAPGTHGAYPFVGDVPKENPEFPSRSAQLAMTRKLEADRNQAIRHAVETGELVWPELSPPPPLSDLSGNMIMAANEENPPPPPAKTENEEEPLPLEAGGGLTQMEEKDGSDIIDRRGLPKVIYHPNSHADIPVSRLPVVPKAPLDVIYPGFEIPKGAKTIRPDINYADPPGTLIRFEPLTDRIASGQEDKFKEILTLTRGGHFRYVVKGFGTALSTEAGLNISDQEREVAFGLLRAQAVAERMIEMGIPPEKISTSAEPIGDGVRVTYVLMMKKKGKLKKAPVLMKEKPPFWDYLKAN